MTNLPGWVQRLRARLPKRSSKGAAELGVVFVSASLVLGVLFGNGLTQTSLDLSDGISWLKDEPSGEVIQVNPATGRPEARLDVGDPGDALDIAQYDGRLIVTNRTTGELISFDLATLLASGSRSVTPGDATKVLHHGDDVFLVDRSQGSVSSVDPVTADLIGEVWVSDSGIVDAGIDGKGTIWVVDDDGLVTGLAWNADASAFDVTQSRTVEGSGPGSVLVAHDRGVTLFGPDNGIVVQIGTGSDVVANAPQLAGTVEQPDQSPRDVVPVSSPETSTVVIVGSDDIREVNLRSVGCKRPGRPQVFRGVVYVPCVGAGKVIRLNPDGSSAGPDILLPDGGDAELVLDDGLLLLNVQGSDRGVQVMPDGSTRTFLRRDPSVPVQPVRHATNDNTSVPDIDQIVDRDRERGRDRNPPPRHERPDRPDNGHHTKTVPATDPDNGTSSKDPGHVPGIDGTNPGGTETDPGGTETETDPGGTETETDPGETETEPPPPAALTAPTGVSATLQSNGSVLVSWSHSGTAATEFRVSRVGGGTLATVAGSARQAVVTVPSGSSSRFVVTAVRDSEEQASSASNAVTPTDRPGAATNVAASGDTRVVGKVERATYRVDWGAAPDNGSAITGYTVTFNTADGSRTVSAGASDRSAEVQFSCLWYYEDPPCYIQGGSFTVSVTATNALGTGPAVTASGNVGAPANPNPEPPPVPSAPGNVTATGSFTRTGNPMYADGTCSASVTWSAASGNGSPIIGYDVSFGSGAAQRFGATVRSASKSWDCMAGRGTTTTTVTVTAVSQQGSGPGASDSATINTGGRWKCWPDPPPGEGQVCR